MQTEANSNPCGIDGVDFVEFTGPDKGYLESLFSRMGFKKTSQVAGKEIYLYQQGEINFVLNCEPKTFAKEFAQMHGPAICSTGFKVKNAEHAFKTAVARGAQPYNGTVEQKGQFPFFAVYGIGESLIYFIDETCEKQLYGGIFKEAQKPGTVAGYGFTIVDHFTNNVPRGEMQKWADFYENVFNFRETRYFNIKGKATGLYSKVMRSPCGKFSVPINEPADGKSQIQEYLDEYKGSGIQHLALLTPDILKTMDLMRATEVPFLTPPPNTYYAMLKDRLPNVSEDVHTLESKAILVDGDHDGYLLQIFTKNLIGPIFFEVIQRKNHFGFGEGNFQALFDAIERDQKDRGYL
jgi:4-hydroxyphenylpyruvate dioxygenase